MGEFLCSFNEGSKKMRNLLGGKGANLSCRRESPRRTNHRRDEDQDTGSRRSYRQRIRRRGKPAACFSAHKQRDKDTYHDRYGVQSRSQRQDCSGTGELERHGICSRLLHQVSQDLRLAGEEDTSEPFHRRI